MIGMSAFFRYSKATACVPRFVVKLTDHPDYFFYLYCVYAGLQGWLALMALVAFPGGSGLELKYAPDGFDYVVRASRDVCAALHAEWLSAKAQNYMPGLDSWMAGCVGPHSC